MKSKTKIKVKTYRMNEETKTMLVKDIPEDALFSGIPDSAETKVDMVFIRIKAGITCLKTGAFYGTAKKVEDYRELTPGKLKEQDIMFDLTVDELCMKASEIAQAELAARVHREKETEHKSAAKHQKELAEHQEEVRLQLARDIDYKQEKRKVNCSEMFDYLTKTAFTLHPNTSMIISQRDLTRDELQMDLPMGEAEQEAEEKDATETEIAFNDATDTEGLVDQALEKIKEQDVTGIAAGFLVDELQISESRSIQLLDVLKNRNIIGTEEEHGLFPVISQD